MFAPRRGMTNGCRVLLLWLLRTTVPGKSGQRAMNANGIVSVPRSKLAADLGVDPARVTEHIRLARRLGLLDVVRRGRHGVTAVYQATIPPSPDGAENAPCIPGRQGAETRRCHGAETAPQKSVSEVRIPPTQEVVGGEGVRHLHHADASVLGVEDPSVDSEHNVASADDAARPESNPDHPNHPRREAS